MKTRGCEHVSISVPVRFVDPNAFDFRIFVQGTWSAYEYDPWLVFRPPEGFTTRG